MAAVLLCGGRPRRRVAFDSEFLQWRWFFRWPYGAIHGIWILLGDDDDRHWIHVQASVYEGHLICLLLHVTKWSMPLES